MERHNTQHNDTQNKDTKHNGIQCLCQVSFMLSVTIKPVMLSVIKFSECCYAECRERNLTIHDEFFITLLLGLCISNLPSEAWLSSFFGVS